MQCVCVCAHRVWCVVNECVGSCRMCGDECLFSLHRSLPRPRSPELVNTFRPHCKQVKRSGPYRPNEQHVCNQTGPWSTWCLTRLGPLISAPWGPKPANLRVNDPWKQPVLNVGKTLGCPDRKSQPEYFRAERPVPYPQCIRASPKIHGRQMWGLLIFLSQRSIPNSSNLISAEWSSAASKQYSK